MTELRRALDADPHCSLAAADLAILEGRDPPPAASGLRMWERHHHDIVVAAKRGDLQLATALLRDHLKDAPWDNIAELIVANAGATTDPGRDNSRRSDATIAEGPIRRLSALNATDCPRRGRVNDEQQP